MRNLGKIFLLGLLLLTNLYALSKEDFDFKISSSKKEVYVGEPFKITFFFKYKMDLKISEANFHPPRFHNFSIQPGKKVPNKVEGEFLTYQLDYILTPQKSGFLEIEPARMDLGILQKNQKNTLRFDRTKWQSIFSNALQIEVKPLPGGVTLFGRYTLKVYVDKNQTKANEPVHLTLEINGTGNMDEILPFNLSTPNAIVYPDKLSKHVILQKNRTIQKRIQKFAFVSDQNFTIPAITLRYFDSRSHQIKTISTKAIPISVTNQQAKTSTTLLQSPKSTSKNIFNLSYTLGLILLGFLTGIGTTLLWYKKNLQKREKTTLTITQKIKKAKEDKTLLHLLLPYLGRSPQLDTIIQQLESNLYAKGGYRIDRQKLAKNFKNYVTISSEEEEIFS